MHVYTSICKSMTLDSKKYFVILRGTKTINPFDCPKRAASVLFLLKNNK